MAKAGQRTTRASKPLSKVDTGVSPRGPKASARLKARATRASKTSKKLIADIDRDDRAGPTGNMPYTMRKRQEDRVKYGLSRKHKVSPAKKRTPKKK